MTYWSKLQTMPRTHNIKLIVKLSTKASLPERGSHNLYKVLNSDLIVIVHTKKNSKVISLTLKTK